MTTVVPLHGKPHDTVSLVRLYRNVTQYGKSLKDTMDEMDVLTAQLIQAHHEYRRLKYRSKWRTFFFGIRRRNLLKAREQISLITRQAAKKRVQILALEKEYNRWIDYLNQQFYRDCNQKLAGISLFNS